MLRRFRSKKMRGVSFVISLRNEFPNICHTVNSLMIDCEQSGIPCEFILVDQASTDNSTRFWKYAWKNAYAKESPVQLRNEYQYSPRGMVNEGLIRFVYDPVYSNVGARHKAVEYARYPNIIFADAHIAVKLNTIKNVLETLDTYGGIVHAPVAWMGASLKHPHPGVQYSFKVGEKIFSTWNFAVVEQDKPFYIPGSGHCFLAVKKKQYLDFGGYDTNQRVYGGGEPYLDTLWWLLGSTVMVDPRALVFHLSAGRGYSYDQRSLIHNMVLTAYALGGHKWSERVLLTYLNKDGGSEWLFRMYSQTIKEAQPKRDFIKSRQIMTFEDFIAIDKPHDCDGKEYKMQSHARRKWDVLNDELYGHHISFVAIFEDWLDRLENPEAIEFYRDSPYQH